MTEKAISPLRRRMIEDMTIRQFAPNTQAFYIRMVRDFTSFLGVAPDQASPLLIELRTMDFDVMGHFFFDGHLKHLLSSLMQGLLQDIEANLACFQIVDRGMFAVGGWVHFGVSYFGC